MKRIISLLLVLVLCLSVFAGCGSKAPADEPAVFRWNDFGKSLAADWGTGIRLDFGFLLLRFDLGMKIHDPARQQKWVNPGTWLQRDNYAVHLGVGYPF